MLKEMGLLSLAQIIDSTVPSMAIFWSGQLSSNAYSLVLSWKEISALIERAEYKHQHWESIRTILIDNRTGHYEVRPIDALQQS